MDQFSFKEDGIRGLYGGLTVDEVKSRKGIQKSDLLSKHMGSTELAANLFRATQTGEKLRRENIQGRSSANRTHFEVGAKVRQTIQELGGTMPEDLPTPEKSIKQIEKQEQKRIDE
jgi:DNA-damage-inducible protein D